MKTIEKANREFGIRTSDFRLPPPTRAPLGFTVVELLVVVTIIGILAGVALGALQKVREVAREAATKATIAKLNSVVMKRYESYLTRRVPIQIPRTANATTAAQMRLDAIRDLMRMEMPDSKADIDNGPVAFTWGSVPRPTLHQLYGLNSPTTNFDAAQCLYKLVSQGSPEAMEQFTATEIGQVDGRPVFVDAWGMPIMFLRWAPGFLMPNSDIQTGDATTDHDPFDTRRVQGEAFHMVPLIYSAGPDRVHGLGINTPAFNGNPYANLTLGQPLGNNHLDNIHNHHIEQR